MFHYEYMKTIGLVLNPVFLKGDNMHNCEKLGLLVCLSIFRAAGFVPSPGCFSVSAAADMVVDGRLPCALLPIPIQYG